MDVKEVLLSSYPKANKVDEIVVEGEVRGYLVKSKTGDAMYVPASVASGKSVDMMSYIPGSGGAKNDAAAILNKINTNPPEYVISISQSSSDGNNSMENCYNTLQQMNLDVEKNVTVCFSAGGAKGLENTNAFLRNHPNVNCSVVVCEPAKDITKLVSSSTALSTLESNNVPIYFVGPDNWNSRNFNYRSIIQKMKEMGFNTYHLQTNYTSSKEHILNNQDVLSGNLVECLLGYEDTFNTDPTKNKPGYRLYQYDPNKKEFVSVPFSNMVGSSNEVIEIPDLDALKTTDDFKVTKTKNPLIDEYGHLGNLCDLKINSPTVISSDYEYLLSSVNSIRGQISRTTFLSGLDNINLRSAGDLMAIINQYLNLFYCISGELLESLSLETEAVISYAQAMVDMDNSISKDASLITEIPLDNESKDFDPVGDIVYDEETSDNGASDDNVDDEDVEDTEDLSDDTSTGSHGSGSSGGHNNGSSGGDYGGGNVTIDNTSDLANNPVNGASKPTYVFDFDDYNALVYMDGDKIIDVKFLFKFDSYVSAQAKYNDIVERFSNKDYIKECLLEGNCINVIFKSDAYKDLSIQEFANKYLSGGEVNA